MTRLFFLVLACVTTLSCLAQDAQQARVKTIYDYELTYGESYSMLEHLCKKVGARLSGSPGAAAAVEWTRSVMNNFADTVWLQPVMVPHWVRGKQEIAK